MKKVYIVTSGSYSDYSIDGVFSTRYRATKYRKKWGGEIEPWNLDEPIPDIFWVVRMRHNGVVVDSWIARSTSVSEEGFHSFTTIFGDAIVWRVKTEDRQRAIKVVNEKRTQILALGIWGDEKKVRRMVA